MLPDDGDYAQAAEAIRAALPEGASIAKVKKLGFGSPEACYQDVKVSIRFANGGIGEVILVSEHMQDAKFNRGGHAVYELYRVLKPNNGLSPEIKAAARSLETLSSAIYSREVDSAAFERAKANASSALTQINPTSLKASLSAEDMMVVKSSASLLKEAKPLSVSSEAIPSSSEIKKGISPDRVAKSASKVKNKLEQSAQKVKDEAPGADADGVLRVKKGDSAKGAQRDAIHAANPWGCNQHGHKPGCPHAGGGVDPDLKQNLEAALRRARREDGSVEQGGELNRTHEVRLREMPDVMKALGEPDVPLVMTVYHIRKLAGKHGLTVEQLQEVAAKLNDPLLVMHAEQQKHLLLLDMEAYEKDDKAMRPVICFVEKKPGKEHAEYVVSAYPLQKEKYGKVIGQSDALKYVKYKDEKTAQFAADAPQSSEARDLLRAAIRSGFADSVLTWEDIVKPKKRPGSDTLYAANPWGCNQHGHKPGCPHAGGGGEIVRKVAASVRDKTLGAKNQQELRAKLPEGKIGQLFSTREEIIAPVSQRLAEAVRQATGRDVSGYSHATTEQNMWHAYAGHSGDSGDTEHEGQRNLTWDDFEKLPDIFENYDTLKIKQCKNGASILVYKKVYPEGALSVIQRVGRQKRSGQSTLNFVTMWAKKRAGGSGIAPDHGQGMKPSSASREIKTQKTEPVKPQSIHAAAKPLRHEEYVPALTPEATYRTSQEWAELAPEMRAGKFFLACVEDERLLLAMHKLVDECMQEGVSEDEFIHRAFLMLGEIEDPATGRPYYDPAARQDMPYDERVAYDNDVKNIDARARLKLIFRTQSELAAGYATWQKALDPDNLRRFPAWRFVRQPGAKIKRPDHVEHENEVRLISDTAYWLARNSPDQGGFNNPFPPFGYNSWMRVERVSRKEAVKLGLLAKDEEPAPPPDADRWSLRQAVEQANTASLDSLPPESVERIKERCRDAGLTLTPAENGGYTAKPAPAKPAPPLPFSDDLEEELNDLMRMLGELDVPRAPATPTLPWLSSLFGKLLPLTDPGDVYAANPYGCNRYGHRCPQKGTTREGETKPRRHQKGTSIEENTQPKGRQTADSLTIRKKCENAKEAERGMNKIRARMVEKKNGKHRGITGEGIKAPDLDVEFFLTKKGMKEMLTPKYVQASADEVSHYTAAANVDKLWMVSRPMFPDGGRYADKKNKPDVKWMYKRDAYMNIGKDTYRVVITAKEPKNQNNDPFLYHIITYKEKAQGIQ